MPGREDEKHTHTCITKQVATFGPVTIFSTFTSTSSTMEDFIADEVESILYIAREISGRPYSLLHVVPTQEELQYIGSRL